MEGNLIILEKFAGIVSVTLNRPEKRNSLNGPLVSELIKILKILSHDTATRVLIIQGNGENFCAGGDILWMQKIVEGPEKDNFDDAQLLAELMYQLYYFPKPTIALAHGATLGGGLGLLAACDIVIASKNASFSFSEVKIGIAPSTISPYVIAAIGVRAAQYYFLTGDRFDAMEAQRIGLIQQVTEEEALLNQGAVIAKRLLANAPNALTAAKLLIRQVSGEKITLELAKQTAQHLAELRQSPEAKEGLKAFVEKRHAKWG